MDADMDIDSEEADDATIGKSDLLDDGVITLESEKSVDDEGDGNF